MLTLIYINTQNTHYYALIAPTIHFDLLTCLEEIPGDKHYIYYGLVACFYGNSIVI